MRVVESLYRCARGHEHRLLLPKPPAVLNQRHGERPGFPPTCPLPLRLQEAAATVPATAAETDPGAGTPEAAPAAAQGSAAPQPSLREPEPEPRWTVERDLPDGGHVGFRIDLLNPSYLAGYKRPYPPGHPEQIANPEKKGWLWLSMRRPTVPQLLADFMRMVDVALLQTVGIPGAMTSTDVPGQFELLPVYDETVNIEECRTAAMTALREMATN